MSFVVQKFGGTSVESPERILSVARKIASRVSQGDSLVVVVSAMGDTTDELLSLAHQISSTPSSREMDMLLSVGERISMSLLSIALSDLGVSAISLTGSQSGIETTSEHQNARILKIRGERIRSGLAQGKVVIVAGFQGVSAEKEITTLGRGGSDTTAVALACSLGASQCEIYTDVDGIYTADPRKIKNSKRLDKVSYALAVELAERGAVVLHPRAARLAKKFNLPVHILSSLEDHPKGTWIMNSEKAVLEASRVTAITQDSEMFFVEVTLSRPGAMLSFLDRFSEIPVSSLVQTGSQVRFFSPNSKRTLIEKELSELTRLEWVQSYQVQSGLGTLSIIGDFFGKGTEELSKSASLLNQNGIEPFRVCQSAASITYAVPHEKLNDAMHILHKAFLE